MFDPRDEARQNERETLLASIAAAEAVKRVELDQRDVERRVLAQLDTWRELLLTNPRQALRESLDGPLEFEPDGRQYRFHGEDRDWQADHGPDRRLHLFWRPQGEASPG